MIAPRCRLPVFAGLLSLSLWLTGGARALPIADGAARVPPFVHPGILVSRGMLELVRSKLAAGAEPWKTAFATASASRFGSLGYTPHARAVVDCGPYSRPDVGCSDEKDDADAAYTHALLWALAGDARHAAKAIDILNAWSSTIRRHTNHNAPLQSAWVAEVFPRAAEILRATNAGWAAAEVTKFATMLREVYLPELVNGSKSNGNWELSMIDGMMAIAIFTEDRPTFERAVAMWRKRTPAYLYLATDGPTPVAPPAGAGSGDALSKYWYGQTRLADGVCQETCRDLGHVQYGLAAMVNAAETARIQGVDLFREQQRRIVAALELHAGLLDGAPVPAWLCGGALSKVKPEPMWEIARNAYADVLGARLPNTTALLQKMRPTGVDHHMVWETLTHAGLGAAGLP